MSQANETKGKDGEGGECGDPARTVGSSFFSFCVVQGEPSFPAVQGERPSAITPEAAIAGV